MMGTLESPIPLSEIESVLEWVDGFKLSRPTKKINRDFSDAVLLAEILAIHYPKLVEMHNYPPRNSHSLKLNNWLTLNRKVLKKLKLNLCCKTMEQLANCAPHIIERVLVMVRDKIRRDEEAQKGKEDQNLSSGGSYYEACGDEEHVLVVPVKSRVNGVLETVHQKVVSHSSYLMVKEDLKDVKESVELLKQKVEHLDCLIKLKDERIEELQKQLDRKQVRRKEVEELTNSLCVPFEIIPSPLPDTNESSLHSISIKQQSLTHVPADDIPIIVEKKDTEIIHPIERRTSSLKSMDSKTKIEESKIPIRQDVKEINSKTKIEESMIPIRQDVKEINSKTKIEESMIPIRQDVKEINSKTKIEESMIPIRQDVKEINSKTKIEESIIPIRQYVKEINSKTKIEESRIPIKQDVKEIVVVDLEDEDNLDRIKSNVFKEIEIVDDKTYVLDADEFQDSEENTKIYSNTSVFKDIEIVDDKTYAQDSNEFKDSEENCKIYNTTTIEESIQNEIKIISNPMKYITDPATQY